MNTALHFAAKKGRIEMAKFLLNNGAIPYAFNCQGQVPHELAPLHAQHIFMICNYCKKQGSIACRHCEVIYYCSKECSNKDYNAHQKIYCKFFQSRKSLDSMKDKDYYK